MPWPGFFHKAARADHLVLLDGVQFPRGRTWLTRNRLKNENGELWLTVPVLKKGRGLQAIRSVEIHNERGWRRKHLQAIRQNYVHAPYFTDCFARVEEIYKKNHALLADFTIEIIAFLIEALSLRSHVHRQSDLGVTGRGTELLAGICKRLNADHFVVLPSAEKHVDAATMKRHGIETVRASFHPPVYPQLWGEFVFNLSTLDLLMNCGPKSRSIVVGTS